MVVLIRKQPPGPIEAVQVVKKEDGSVELSETPRWVEAELDSHFIESIGDAYSIYVNTAADYHWAEVGDWIVRDDNGTCVYTDEDLDREFNKVPSSQEIHVL